MAVATRVANPVNSAFVSQVVAPRLGLSGRPLILQLGVYLGYAVLLGPLWDVTCPDADDFGGNAGGEYTGTSWVLLAFVEEFGWSGLLFPSLWRANPRSPRAFTRAAALTSVVWVLWHVPFVVASGVCCEDLIPSSAAYEPGTDPQWGVPPTPLFWAVPGFALDLCLARVIMCLFQLEVASCLPMFFVLRPSTAITTNPLSPA